MYDKRFQNGEILCRPSLTKQYMYLAIAVSGVCLSTYVLDSHSSGNCSLLSQLPQATGNTWVVYEDEYFDSIYIIYIFTCISMF